MSTKQDLQIFKRNDINYKMTILDEEGVAVDITNFTFYLTVKPDTDDDSGSDSTAVIKIEKGTHTDPNDDPTNGITYLTLVRASTVIPAANYYYDLRVISDVDVQSTLFYGRFCIKQDITEEE